MTAPVVNASYAGQSWQFAAMLRNLRRTSVLPLMSGLALLAQACVSSSALEEPSNTPILPSPTPLPDGITLYSGNDCKDQTVGVTDSAPDQFIQFASDDRFQDDEARSLLFRRLAPGTIIRLYADSAGNTSNDWTEILVKQEVEGYCVISFEVSFEDAVISVNFSNVDGLDGKVSLMAVDRVMVEIQPPTDDSTPTVEPTADFTAVPMPTFTPLPAIPPIPEAECIPTVTEKEFATVSNVVNGDTIDVLIDGVSFRVRYIGVDAPEAGEPYFSQATSQNTELVQGKTVTLVKDASNTDEEGSLLRYVLFGNAFVNYSLVREGSAHASISHPDVACDMTFAEAQNQAVSESAGQWALIPTPLSPTHTPASVPNMQITFILFDGAVPSVESDEFAQITNQGSLAVNLQGWRLNAGAPGLDFNFPNFQLDPGLSCRIYTNEIHPEYCGFSFGRVEAIWKNTGDCGYLYDDEGAQVSKYCY